MVTPKTYLIARLLSNTLISRAYVESLVKNVDNCYQGFETFAEADAYYELARGAGLLKIVG